MSKAFVTVLILKNKNLCVTIYSKSNVQFRCRWQTIVQKDSRLQNSSFKLLSRLAFIVEYGVEIQIAFTNFKIALQIMVTTGNIYYKMRPIFQ